MRYVVPRGEQTAPIIGPTARFSIWLTRNAGRGRTLGLKTRHGNVYEFPVTFARTMLRKRRADPFWHDATIHDAVSFYFAENCTYFAGDVGKKDYRAEIFTTVAKIATISIHLMYSVHCQQLCCSFSMN